MNPVRLEVIALRLVSLDQTPEGFAYSREIFDEAGLTEKYAAERAGFPQDVWDEHQDLLHWMTELKEIYGKRLEIHLIDPRSLMGTYKSLRYRVRRYPTFILDGDRIHTGWHRDVVDAIVRERVSSTACPLRSAT